MKQIPNLIEHFEDVINKNFDEHMGSNEAVLQASEDIKILFVEVLEELLKHSTEVIAINGIRFTGIHEEHIKQIFENIDVKTPTKF